MRKTVHSLFHVSAMLEQRSKTRKQRGSQFMFIVSVYVCILIISTGDIEPCFNAQKSDLFRPCPPWRLSYKLRPKRYTNTSGHIPKNLQHRQSPPCFFFAPWKEHGENVPPGHPGKNQIHLNVRSYPSSHNHGSGTIGPSDSSYLLNTAVFHFHDYGRKSNLDVPKISNDLFNRKVKLE